MNKYALLLSGLLAFSAPLSGSHPAAAAPLAKADEISFPNSYRRSLTSKVNGVTYGLRIFLPQSYDPAKAHRYPVFYFIRGEHFGAYFAELARILSAGDISPIIVVGIDFPADQSYFMDLPTAGHDPHWTVPENRGAANFLKILTTEIKPLIDQEFPTNPDDTGIGGHSMGGFFALYALFSAPDIFSHVYASSPSLIWQDQVLLRYEAALAAHGKDLHARVFVDEGEQESQDERLSALDKAIRSRTYPSLRWTARRTAGQTHQTIAFANGLDALYFIYGPDLRQADQAEIDELSGEWQRSDGEHFRIRATEGRMYLVGFDDEDDVQTEILSEKRGEWFIRYLWHRFRVERDAAGTVTLVFEMQDTPGPNGEAKAPRLTARRKAFRPQS